MPEIFIDGQAVEAQDGQTVMEVARAHGFDIPHFCWHPALSVIGSCRLCMVEQEGRGLNVACKMPVQAGMRILTDSERVRAMRKAMLQFFTLNHPVDCGICDKAGECLLQDYHYQHNGSPSISVDPKVHATKFYELSSRILLDNERCVLCSRCVRFTREVSKSHVLGIEYRGDHALVRPAEDRNLDDDPYSDNVIDLCPVGALQSRSFLYQARVWYLTATPSVCPGCARGCTVRLWHRKPEWRLNALDPRHNTRIVRVTPLENPAVNGPWICNKGRDLAAVFERPRATEPMLKGEPVDLEAAIEAARLLIAGSRNRVAIVSSWGSNEELAAFNTYLGAACNCVVKPDHLPLPGEVVEDDLLIRADKNPNIAAAQALFGNEPFECRPETDLVLVWGEGFSLGACPPHVRVILLGSYLPAPPGQETDGVPADPTRADVFIPISIQTERAGHYTNFEGVVSRFEPCFPKPASVIDAEVLFARLAASDGGRPA